VLRSIPDTTIFDLRASPMTTGMGRITFEEDRPNARG
jgi:hypothetical protein